jgi:hypothetical protein
MVQFLQDQTLQSFRNLLIGRIYAGLRQKAAQVDILDLEPKLIFPSHDASRPLTAGKVGLPASNATLAAAARLTRKTPSRGG